MVARALVVAALAAGARAAEFTVRLERTGDEDASGTFVLTEVELYVGDQFDVERFPTKLALRDATSSSSFSSSFGPSEAIDGSTSQNCQYIWHSCFAAEADDSDPFWEAKFDWPSDTFDAPAFRVVAYPRTDRRDDGLVGTAVSVAGQVVGTVTERASPATGDVHDFRVVRSPPTDAPTMSPSNNPTATPTASPSASPVVAPTAAPSALPTVSPTAAPTSSPAAAPVASSSSAPTTASAPGSGSTASPTAEGGLRTDAPTAAGSDTGMMGAIGAVAGVGVVLAGVGVATFVRRRRRRSDMELRVNPVKPDEIKRRVSPNPAFMPKPPSGPMPEPPVSPPPARITPGLACIARFDCVGEEDDELTCPAGTVLIAVSQPEANWWLVRSPATNERGLVPANILEARPYESV